MTSRTSKVNVEETDPLEFCACTVIVWLWIVVGVPQITALSPPLKVSPAGRFPDVIEKERFVPSVKLFARQSYLSLIKVLLENSIPEGAIGSIVKVNVREELSIPSVTLKVILEVPIWWSVVVILAVQFGTVPPHTIASFETNARLLLVIEIELPQLRVESTSLTVTFILGMCLLVVGFRLFIAAITGASLTGEIVKLTGAEFEINRPVVTV